MMAKECACKRLARGDKERLGSFGKRYMANKKKRQRREKREKKSKPTRFRFNLFERFRK